MGTITETIAALRKDAPVQMVPCLLKRLLLFILLFHKSNFTMRRIQMHVDTDKHYIIKTYILN